MKFELSLETEGLELACGSSSKCTITYTKQYTPIIYYLNPPVVYQNSITEIWFNPKSTMNLIDDLLTDELPFINTKIGNALINFEDFVDSTTTFKHN
jgi:hypothetical protein